MPDMISRLSDPDIGIDEEHFRIIMKYVLPRTVNSLVFVGMKLVSQKNEIYKNIHTTK
jgi:hypothetical protein